MTSERVTYDASKMSGLRRRVSSSKKKTPLRDRLHAMRVRGAFMPKKRTR